MNLASRAAGRAIEKSNRFDTISLMSHPVILHPRNPRDEANPAGIQAPEAGEVPLPSHILRRAHLTFLCL